MEKIFYSAFDFFSYAIPGCFVLLACWLLHPDYAQLSDYLYEIGKLGVIHGIFILLISLVIGFAVNPIGRALYRSLGFKLFNHSFTNLPGLSISEKYTLIRQFSPENFKYVEIWNMMGTMAHNLAFAALLIVANSLIKAFWIHPANMGFWLLIAFAALVLLFLFLARAVKYFVWAADDINAAIRKLHLEERAEGMKHTGG